MSGPLLIADVPWLLYRSFFALPRSIVDGEGRTVNALLGTVNAILSVIDARLPARRVRGGGLPRAALPPLPRPPRGDARRAGTAVAGGAPPAREPGLDGGRQRGPRGRRRDVLLRPRRAGCRRQRPTADGRPRPVRSGERPGCGRRSEGGARGRADRPRGGEGALRGGSRAGPRLHRPAG